MTSGVWTRLIYPGRKALPRLPLTRRHLTKCELFLSEPINRGYHIPEPAVRQGLRQSVRARLKTLSQHEVYVAHLSRRQEHLHGPGLNRHINMHDLTQ